MDTNQLTRHLNLSSNFGKVLLGVVAITLIVGIGVGYALTTTGGRGKLASSIASNQPPKQAQDDMRTFRDFAEGTLQKRPPSKNQGEYVEGTHILVRDGAVPVALTSSVVDLSLYEGKKVKVFGETQKAIKEGWLMDVGKVEEIK